MTKTKVKSREEELQEQWMKYFKNIDKENDIIRTLLNYYKEELYYYVEKSSEVDRDETIKNKDVFGYKMSDFKQEIEDNLDSAKIEDVDKIENYELRYVFAVIIDHINRIKNKIPKIKLNPFRKYLTILQNIQKETQNLRHQSQENAKFVKNCFDSLYLGNFKGFSEDNAKKDNTINIKPITLIYGPNSYGKSSILQSLLLLNQTVNQGGDYRDVCLLLNGETANVRLGEFRDFLNMNAHNKEVTIELSLPWDHYVVEDNAKILNDIIDITLKEEEDDEKTQTAALQDTSRLTKLYFSYHFGLCNNKIIMPQVDIYAEQLDYENIDNIKEYPKKLWCSLKKKQDSKKNNEIYEIENLNEEIFGSFDNIKEIKKFSFFKFEELLQNNPFEQVEETIKDIIYVSSFRKPPERYYVPENNTRRYVGKNGEHTAEILYDSEVNKDINKWLKKIAGYELVDKNTNKNAKVNSISLNDRATHINSINLIDLGSGIAQVLPIITQAFKSENDIILIEEPEIHLHPKAQAVLGEMFAKAAQHKGNTFIIETHSENLMLRLGKLIRKGELSKDDVSIIYVNKDDTGSHCIPLILDDEGDIVNINEIPGGFFDESFEELFLS